MRNEQIKIFSALILAFILTKFLSSNFFIKTTPIFNQNALNNLKKSFSNFTNNLARTLSTKNKLNKNLSRNRENLSMRFEKVTLTPTLPSKPSPSPTSLPKSQPTILPLSYLSPTITPTKIPTPQIISQNLSSSKLGVFILVNYTEGAEKILNAGPRIIKFIDPQYQPAFMEAAKNYKKNFPQGIIVLRFWNGTPGLKYELNNDPIRSADDFFAKVNQPAFNALGGDISYFDYLQTPNEFETTPEWWGKEKTQWNGKFWRRLTQLNKNAGIKTCIGGIPVGNVEASDLGYIIEDLRAIKDLGGAFCYHGYTFEYSTDVNREIQLSLRYRQFYDFFKNNAPDLVNMPLILSEGGVAEGGDPKGGYLRSQSIDRYKNWLVWFDNELKKDPYVIGVTLFQIGNNSDWAYFNLDPIADWLANYLKQ